MHMDDRFVFGRAENGLTDLSALLTNLNVRSTLFCLCNMISELMLPLDMLSNTELVPAYAFEAWNNTKHHLWLRCGGVHGGLDFMFIQQDPSDLQPLQGLVAC